MLTKQTMTKLVTKLQQRLEQVKSTNSEKNKRQWYLQNYFRKTKITRMNSTVLTLVHWQLEGVDI